MTLPTKTAQAIPIIPIDWAKIDANIAIDSILIREKYTKTLGF